MLTRMCLIEASKPASLTRSSVSLQVLRNSIVQMISLWILWSNAVSMSSDFLHHTSNACENKCCWKSIDACDGNSANTEFNAPLSIFH